MKKLLLLFSAILFSVYLIDAQVAPPQAFSYKATIISKSGAVVASRPVSLRISILRNSMLGIAVYSEIFYVKTSEYGQVDLFIGKGNPVIGNFSSIEWSDDDYFLSTEVDVKGGTEFIPMSTVQLLSVPYSLLSDKSNFAFSADEKDPLFSAHPANQISHGDLSNWNEAAGWGDHSKAGYVPFDSVYTKSDLRVNGRSEISWSNLAAHPAKNISGDDITNWNAAFGWGDHAVAGYAIADSVYTKSDLQTDGKSEVSWNNLVNKPEFAVVATTGRYNDLLNLPEIPNSLSQLTPDAGNRAITNVAKPVNQNDAATKAYVDELVERITALEKAAGIVHIERDSVQDSEGNTYRTVKIGDQWWMAENLRSTRFSNGEPVKKVTENVTWSNLNIGSAYCFYNNDSSSYYNTYGRLYNWYAVNDPRNVCPSGWHVPSEGEWTTLAKYAGGEVIAGGKLKEKDLVHWTIQNVGATDEYGFTALPGGTRNTNGTFTGIGTMGHFWSSSAADSGNALFWRVTNNAVTFPVTRALKTLGASIRCIRGDSAPSTFAVVTTDSVTNITSTGSTSGGNVISDSGDKVTARGVCWSTTPAPLALGMKTVDGADTGKFVSTITNLAAGRKFYVRAYATNSAGTAYGNEISFTTLPGLAIMSSFDVTSVSATSAVCSGLVSFDGGSPVTAKGICWGQVPMPTIENDTTNEGPGSGAFASTLTGLQPGTSYSFRPYAINAVGVSYGPARGFLTPQLPISVSTDPVGTVTESTAVIGGTYTGTATVAEHGICWNTAPNPTAWHNKIVSNSDSGSYQLTLTGLAPNTNYYARSYAVVTPDTIYGEEVSFTTPGSVTGTVTDADGNIYNTVTIGSQTWLKENLRTTKYRNGDPVPNITGPEWNTQTSGAYCWYNNDTLNRNVYGALYNWYASSDPRNICPAGWHEPTNGEFSVLIMYLGGEAVAGGKLKEAGLSHWITPNAGATNESGFTALPGGIRDPNGTFSQSGRNGNLWSATEADAASGYFLSLNYVAPTSSVYRNPKTIGTAVRCIKGEAAPVNLPQVTTAPVTDITSTGATSGGTVISDGGETVVARGVCYNNSPNPTIGHGKTINGGGTGEFISNISNLQPVRTLYLRAYATNAAGTSYGNEISFTTLPGLASVGINAVTAITENSANVAATVGFDGGSPVTARGVCWNTADMPTIENDRTVEGSGTGNFTSILTGLIRGTKYFVRAYATNSSGTAYGTVRTFYTLPNMIVTTDPVTSVTGITAMAGGWVKASEFPVIERGICWSTLPNPTPVPNGSDYWGHVNCGADTGRFTCSINGLPAGRMIYVRAYGYNNRNQTVFGNEVSFTTLSAPGPINDTVYLSTIQVSSIGATTATGGGNITDANGHIILTRGICWGSNIHPTYFQGDTASAGSGTGSYSCTMKDLMPGSQYYVRAFARTPEGIFYGNDLTFTTATGPLTIPNISTTLNQVTNSTVSVSGRVFGSEGYLISERGLCWDTSPDPLITANKLIMGSDTGWYNHTFMGLTPGVTYYSRSYAIKYGQVIYGNSVAFVTGENPAGTPVIFTNYVVPRLSGANVTGHIIKSDLPMTEAGVCWNDSSNPSISENKLNVAPVLGTFTIDIPGLIPGKTYSIRTFAVNSLGTGYGNIIVFTMPPEN